MSDLLVEENLNKARSLYIKGKEAEASDLLSSIIKQFPQNKKVQHVLQQLQQSTIKHLKPTQEQINTLLKYYKNGQLSEAENLAISLTKEFPTHPFGWKVLGVILGDTGRKNEALRAHQKAIEIAPQDTGSYNNLGNTLKGLGRFEEAELSFKQSIKLNPKSAIAHNNLGTLLKDTERLDEAKASFEEAIRLNPDFAEAHNNLGLALVDLYKYEDAEACYNRAIKLNPNFAEAYNNLGILLQDQGKSEEAVEAYKKTLSLKSHYPEAYNNLGVALQDKGKLGEAVEAYNKSILLKPDYAEAYNNLGNILHELHKVEESIEAFKKALSLKPDYAEAYFNIGSTLKGITYQKADPDLQKIISILLDKKIYVRPQDITSLVISLSKAEPKLKRHLEIQKIADVEFKPQEVIADLSDLSLLLKFMSVCPIADTDLEKLFKKLRNNLLLSINEIDNSPEVLKLQSSLALQCFTNEYIYEQSEDEEKALELLEELVKQNLNNNNQPSPQKILCLASYKSLNHYEWSNSLIVTDEIKDVFIRQVIEPKIEINLKQSLPLLENITNKISSKVKGQYETSPYPKWVNLKLQLKPATVSKVLSELKLKTFDDKIKEIERPDILIAGCGTGQHSIETAARFKDSKVLAVDLSTSSLSYAKRKTEELNIKNIDYMQADILDLDKQDRQFDIVESVGVLHHMDKPIVGWKKLKDCLKPGGLMKIGLYSELARQHIVKMRKEISKAGFGSSDTEMRSFRNMLMKSDKNHHKLILNSPDLYSVSTLKDLLFHVQEHRFTITQIQDCLSELGMKFCGFEAKQIVLHFKQINTGDSDPYNLDKWKAYEEANPRTFAGMYQFWCQKIV